MVGDHYNEKWPWQVPDGPPYDQPNLPGLPGIPRIDPTPWIDRPGSPRRLPPIRPVKPNPEPSYPQAPPVTREEFDKLREDVQEMIDLLKRAKEYDKQNNEPDCELEEKMAKLRKIAELVGINLDEVV